MAAAWNRSASQTIICPIWSDTDRISVSLPATERRLALFVCLSLLLAACSAFKESPTDGATDGAAGDAGADLSIPPVGCTGTSVRAHMLLGNASDESSEGSTIPLLAGGAGVVWENVPASGSPSVYWAELDMAGSVTNTAKLVPGQDPVLLRLDDGLRLFWRDGTALKMLRLDEQGIAQGTAVTVHSPVTSIFDVADSGEVFGVVISGVDPKGDLVHFMRVSHDGSPMEQPAALPEQGINSTLGVIAWTGSRFAVAWTDMREGTPAVYLATLDAQGKRLTPDRRISQAGVRGSFPTVAPQYNRGFAVCYQQKMTNDIQDIFCTRLDEQAQVTNTTRLTQSAYDSQNPHAVAHGTHTWVLWDDVHDIDDGTVIHWQFLNLSGDTVLPQPKHSSTLPGWRPHGAAANDGLYLLKYRQDYSAGWLAEVGVLNCF